MMCLGGGDCSVYSSDSEVDDPNNSNSAANHRVNLAIDNWIKFKLEPQNAELVIHLRQKWHALILRRLAQPNRPLHQADEVTHQHHAYSL